MLKRVVYLTEAQKDTLFTNNTITVGDTTVTYSDDDLYVTPDSDSDAAIVSNTTEYWTSSNYTPPAGTIVIYTDKIVGPPAVPGIKIGDGSTVVTSLPFIDTDASEAQKVSHKLTFGNGTYVFDGSADVTVPVYDGTYSIT